MHNNDEQNEKPIRKTEVREATEEIAHDFANSVVLVNPVLMTILPPMYPDLRSLLN